MRALRVAAALLAVVALPRSEAWACSCIAATPQQYLERATVAFTGEALVVQSQGGGVVAATFAVSRAFKGSVGDEISVFTGTGADACGIAFAEKRSYTVFARAAKSGPLVTGLCDGTAEGHLLGPPESASAAPASPSPVRQVAAPVALPREPSSRALPVASASALAMAVAVALLRRLSAA